MKLRRFIRDFKLSTDKINLSDQGVINQIKNVFRLKVGDLIILADGNFNEVKARIINFGKNGMEIEVTERYQNQNEPLNHIILYCAVLKKENFELVVQKSTEVGVKEIVPIITERTVKLNLRKDRLEKIVKEASEQSGRGIVPILGDPVSFDKAVVGSKNNDLNLIFDLSGVSFGNMERLGNEGHIGAWIGPEGGWTDQEIELARGSNFKIINLGKLTLRAETAAIVATYIVVHNYHCR
ncbi:MAG: hypothetical protein A3B91_04220 [Candidatus Yanofskybacteria bacterium RIFCSPHIGHO2_02_FULL_41_29]|uniref:Ribosomal RNA small subunit methyltransferase E n=1 Tax=Candidatus Yanofskybacteria bacterium RIFCSPHIGHO2_01_FULL_41_53 TaxID=1802663 RepID=A0A1F8EHT4_9BACT|nr:MAG: hypothetical protein A2650_03480 [Candidatus Yanofskybacteria bacterium RIFCSPHIGHO2_01_FULL_41_53]OGN11729.1 MAG: hypothetical protein A3B91_04220 [Candidatus Yanofskybacteria bacterium RIFCSPHIGHO2_02_FULL_41_29]OGN17494.1 MAG: hypothetical protein A3F48_01780 [Candidatus Yanofskybacteria bacterium RIFCSPHIGHO2_12_FULL_41_9]OGN22883.1 MAG: hypothetical protein A2916_00675 [Candidatus Yanofskybacteria bacterium RIFCSPLOWO2_01_FULL_41_67]OGN28711.1 MAG: hypothetical protein A3H54_02325 